MASAQSDVLEVPAACLSYGCGEMEALLETLGHKMQLANRAQHLVVQTCNKSLDAVLSLPWNAPLSDTSTAPAPQPHHRPPFQHNAAICAPLLSTPVAPSCPPPPVSLQYNSTALCSTSQALLSIRLQVHPRNTMAPCDASRCMSQPSARSTGKLSTSSAQTSWADSGPIEVQAAAAHPAHTAPAGGVSTSTEPRTGLNNPGNAATAGGVNAGTTAHAGSVSSGSSNMTALQTGSATGTVHGGTGTVHGGVTAEDRAMLWTCRRALVVLLAQDGSPVMSESHYQQEGSSVLLEVKVPLSAVTCGAGGLDAQAFWGAVWLELWSPTSHPSPSCCTLLLPLEEPPVGLDAIKSEAAARHQQSSTLSAARKRQEHRPQFIDSRSHSSQDAGQHSRLRVERCSRQLGQGLEESGTPTEVTRELHVRRASSGVHGPDLSALPAWLAAAPGFVCMRQSGAQVHTAASSQPSLQWSLSSSRLPCGQVQVVGCSPSTAELVLRSNSSTIGALQRAVERACNQHCKGAEIIIQPNHLSAASLQDCQQKLDAMSATLERSIACLNFWLDDSAARTGNAGDTNIVDADAAAVAQNEVLTATMPLNHMQDALQHNCAVLDILA